MMKSMLVLFALLPFSLAASATEGECECAKAKCSGTFPDVCLCENEAQIACYKKCGFQPTILPCPIETSALEAHSTTPTTAMDSTPTPTPTCSCEPMACIQEWPQSCYCENEVKLDCYNKCGGPMPVILPCPAIPPTSVVAVRAPTPTTFSPLPQR